MMDKIKQYKKEILLLSFAIGAVGHLDILPEELPMIGTLAPFLYVGVVALGAYTFWNFYENQNIQRQPQQRVRTIPRRQPPQQPQRKSSTERIFEQFHKE